MEIGSASRIRRDVRLSGLGTDILVDVLVTSEKPDQAQRIHRKLERVIDDAIDALNQGKL